MKFRYSIVFLLLPFLASSHGGHEAFYTIEQQESEWTMLVKMEMADIRKELEKNQISTGNLGSGINDYLLDRFSVKVNDVSLKMEFISSFEQKGYISCRFHLTPAVQAVEVIQIDNRCFEDFDHLYHNLVTVIVKGENISYKMTKDRQTISHQFK